MDIDSIIITGRVVERLTIILIGGMSLGMGWHLYVKGVDKKQVAEIKHQETLIRFRDVGPGAFFAVFGAVILIAALGRSLNYGVEEKVVSSINSQAHTAYANLSSSSVKTPSSEVGNATDVVQSKKDIKFGTSIDIGLQTIDVITAITTIHKDMRPPMVSFNNKNEEKALQDSVNILLKHKDALLTAEYQAYPEYKKQKEAVLQGIQPDFGKIDKKTFENISEIDQKMF